MTNNAGNSAPLQTAQLASFKSATLAPDLHSLRSASLSLSWGPNHLSVLASYPLPRMTSPPIVSFFERLLYYICHWLSMLGPALPMPPVRRFSIYRAFPPPKGE